MEFNNKSTVYGPVTSWRFGQSLGIDPIFKTSTCSFDCIYCQLGKIQNVTLKREEYVPTQTVLNDLKDIISNKVEIDVITYSGSGEPSLATNLSEMIHGVREILPDTPQYILTNGTTLGDSQVVESLKLLDCVTIKLDALTQKEYEQINRPAQGINVERMIEDIIAFREIYQGTIEIQTMLMPINIKKMESYAQVINKIKPNAIQFNLPKRPYPLSWHRENRGNHKLIFDYEVRNLKQIDSKVYEDFIQNFQKMSDVKVIRK